jgi:lipopolysaccharide/colanic/teichoic acid biosynthesis glycosyltransferase
MKRIFDFFGALLGLFIFALPLAILIIAIRVKLGAPVFFKQLRPGLNAQPFEMIKFRTMTDARGNDGELLPDSERLTNFGRFLRSTSLDELPELLNVLKGEMSLVGPRPLLVEYLKFYSSDQMRRHEVRPGLTGWAQVNGRNTLTWDEKFKLDLWYVNNRSLRLDIVIIIKTIFNVINREGISPNDQEIMPRFDERKNSARKLNRKS